MKVGDLVRTKEPYTWDGLYPTYGVIVDLVEDELADDMAADIDTFAIVFWNEKFPAEEEYLDQLEVVSESRGHGESQH